GTDPEVWKRAMRMTLDLVAQFPDGAAVNLGGGFKVGRMPEEPSVDMDEVAAHVRGELEAFRQRDGRALRLEIEPGTYLVAQAGDLVVGGGAGAYCAAMSTINYNSYPQAPEVMLEPDGTLRLLRERQSLDQMLANEVGPS